MFSKDKKDSKSFWNVYKIDEIKNEIDFIKERDKTVWKLLEDLICERVGFHGLDQRLDAWIDAWEQVDDDKYEKGVNKDSLNNYINTFLGKLVRIQIGLKDLLIEEASDEISHLKKIISKLSDGELCNEENEED